MAWRMSKIERKQKEIRDVKSALWAATDSGIRRNLEIALDQLYKELEELESGRKEA